MTGSVRWEDDVRSPKGGDLVRRHRLSTRIWHWTNAVALLVLLMSGLMIFNAHPRLYWGEYGANPDPAWLEIGSRGDQGFLRVGKVEVPTTGVLGRWRDANGVTRSRAFGVTRSRAFPHWATIPSHYSLADGRLWHLAFAWILALSLALYMLWSLVNGHVGRDLHVRREQWSPRHIWHDLKDHARLRFPTGAAALDYNVLQKLSYVTVIFVLLPLMIATGLTMSPNLNAGLRWLLDLFGGRQSARSIHFICAGGLVAFFIVHIAMVFAAGPIREIRSIVTGWYRLPEDRAQESDAP
ncbi:cytochrome b/b6 domain-containing protein [Novosphingobium aquimarinum]|uniref:cytochrome b/b6 domain-containing protein n=1 Tax=Novosphingobium aquimarinum TaxID=2682494 RepID=UPI0012EB8A8A|nr:cytochrome b/b6 domain-containing protein [Novosphingobium aquimarinum]